MVVIKLASSLSKDTVRSSYVLIIIVLFFKNQAKSAPPFYGLNLI